MIETKFEHSSRGSGRPQILLVGNGLERKSGQADWATLLKKLTVEDSIPLTDTQKDSIPFPLQYQLLVTHTPAPTRLSAQDIQEEEHRLAETMLTLTNSSNTFLDMLPTLDADHIFTTNYSHCIEKAFFPKLDFASSRVRSKKRFGLMLNKESNKLLQERDYRLHSGYLARSKTRNTGIWHIHGEMFNPRGIILSHDRYGRLLNRIESTCQKQRYSRSSTEASIKKYTSWPELFLYGDVYVLGLKLDPTEFDLWWLIRRKQREYYADGKIYYYERRPATGFTENKHLLMQACGIELCDAGCDQSVDFDDFYIAALEQIKLRIERSRKI